VENRNSQDTRNADPDEEGKNDAKKEVSSDKNEKVCVVSADYKRPSQLFAG